MGRASNFIRRPARPDAPPALRPAAPGEVGDALRLVLGRSAHPADDAHVAEFIQFAGRRGINVGEAWVAERGGAMAWALLPIVSPGRTMLLLTPGGAPAEPADRAVGAELIHAACEHYGGRGVLLAQVLLDPSDAAAICLHEGCAFGRVAQLIYLHATPRRKATPPALAAGMRWVTYGPETHADFAATIAATYAQSLDCPVLNGMRDIEDVLAGHKSSGEFDPRLWALLCDGERPLGALLLAPMRPGETLELVYLGLVPAARGRGLADVMMRQALAVAARGPGRLSLAVDSQNAPALKLYYRHGMQRAGAKLAMMRRLDARRPQ